MSGILVDSSVIIDYLKDEIDGKALKILENALWFVSIITHYEVCRHFYKIGRVKDLEIVRKRLEAFRTVPLTPDVCASAARISMLHNLSAGDSIVYASAKASGLELLTFDSDLKGKEGVLFMKRKGLKLQGRASP